MKFVSLLGIAGMTLAAFGCSTEVSDADVDEETSASESELSAAASQLAGSYEDNAAVPFKSIVFKNDGSFSAEVDSLLRIYCRPGGPCPSPRTATVEGRFRATKRTLTLTPKTVMPAASNIAGRYAYTLVGSKLALTHAWPNSFAQSLARKEPTPAFCADGDLVSGPPSYSEATDGKECKIPAQHCVTRDSWSCPMFSPLPPDFCADGEIVRGDDSFIASSDGKECRIPSVHCVTRDSWSCPMFSSLPPDYCADGTLERGSQSFTGSADGKECRLPSVHCLSKDAAACPAPSGK